MGRPQKRGKKDSDGPPKKFDPDRLTDIVAEAVQGNKMAGPIIETIAKKAAEHGGLTEWLADEVSTDEKAIATATYLDAAYPALPGVREYYPAQCCTQ